MKHRGKKMPWSSHQFCVIVVDGVFFSFFFILLPLCRSQSQGHLNGDDSSKKNDPLAVHCQEILRTQSFKNKIYDQSAQSGGICQ